MKQPDRPGWYPDPADPDIEWRWAGGEWGESRSRKSRKRTRVIVSALIGGLLGYAAFSVVKGFGAADDHDLPAARTVPIETLLDRALAPLDDGGASSAVSACISAVKEQLGYPVGTAFTSVTWSGPGPRAESPVNQPWVVSGEYTTPNTEDGAELFRCEVTPDAVTEQMTATVVVP